MNGIFLRLVERMIINLVLVYRDAIEYYEEAETENMNTGEIESKNRPLQAYKIY